MMSAANYALHADVKFESRWLTLQSVGIVNEAFLLFIFFERDTFHSTLDHFSGYAEENY